MYYCGSQSVFYLFFSPFWVCSILCSGEILVGGLVAQPQDAPHQRHLAPHQAPPVGADVLGNGGFFGACRLRRRLVHEH